MTRMDPLSQELSLLRPLEFSATRTFLVNAMRQETSRAQDRRLYQHEERIYREMSDAKESISLGA